MKLVEIPCRPSALLENRKTGWQPGPPKSAGGAAAPRADDRVGPLVGKTVFLIYQNTVVLRKNHLCRTADVLPVVVSCRDRYEKGFWHDHLFAKRPNLLFGVAIRFLAGPLLFGKSGCN